MPARAGSCRLETVATDAAPIRHPTTTAERLSLPLWTERYAAPLAPTTAAEMRDRGWDAVDVVFVTGDAYVDHPSFAMAILHRVLEQAGFRVAILSQPDWQIVRAVAAVRPAAAVLRASARGTWTRSSTTTPPTRRSATTTPTRPAAGSACGPTARRCRTASGAARRSPACRSSPAASRRRCGGWPTTTTGATRSSGRSCSTARPTWSSTAWASRPSSRSPSGWRRARRCKDLRDLRGVAYALGAKESELQSQAHGRRNSLGFEQVEPIPVVRRGARRQARLRRGDAAHPHQHEPVQRRDAGAVPRPPGRRADAAGAAALAETEMDAIYDLPYTRRPHPSYTEPIPAHEMIKDSVTIMRGCFGGCTFCSITAHQGRIIQIALAGVDPQGSREARGRPGVQGRHQRHRRPDREHVPDALHAARGRGEVQAAVVRPPVDLQAARHRPRPARSN